MKPSTRGKAQKFVICLGLFMIGLTCTVQVSKASYASASVDGLLDPSYTMVFNGTQKGSNISLYQSNTQSYFYFYAVSLTNETFSSLKLTYPGIVITANEAVGFANLYKVAFSSDRSGVEFMLLSTFVASNFTFQLNTAQFTFSISAFPKPEDPTTKPPPDIGLTEIVKWLGDLMFAQSWLSVIFWVVIVIWFWRALTRKIWIMREPGSLIGRDFGRWIKEESVLLKGETQTRLWRHTFKCDVGKTVKVQQVYSRYNREELIAKGKFKQIAGFWLMMPYVRVGKFKLRPDQYYYELIFKKSLINYLNKFFYYILCWVPKLNDALYSKIKFVEDEKRVVKEIDFLFLTYAEERVIQVFPTEWKEKELDRDKFEYKDVMRKQDLTKEELALIQNNTNVYKDSIVTGKPYMEVRRYDDLDQAINDKLSREELMATYMYKQSVLDNKIDGLNDRFLGVVDQLNFERRERGNEIQNVLAKMEDHSEFLKQNMPTYLARALGLKNLGMGSKTVIETVLKEALQEFYKHSDDLHKKDLQERNAEVKDLNDEIEKLKRELKKKTQNDIVNGEISVEYETTEEA